MRQPQCTQKNMRMHNSLQLAILRCIAQSEASRLHCVAASRHLPDNAAVHSVHSIPGMHSHLSQQREHFLLCSHTGIFMGAACSSPQLPCKYSLHIATTSALALLLPSPITLRTSAALPELRAILNASSKQDSRKNASTCSGVITRHMGSSDRQPLPSALLRAQSPQTYLNLRIACMQGLVESTGVLP